MKKHLLTPSFFLAGTLLLISLSSGGMSAYAADCSDNPPNCRANIGGTVGSGTGLCQELKAEGKCGCVPVDGGGSSSSGGCPDGLEDGGTYTCEAWYMGDRGRTYKGDWQCDNEGSCSETEEKNDEGGVKKDPGKNYSQSTGMGDGRGIVESTPLTRDGSPTMVRGNYQSKDYSRLYQVVSTQWAADALINSWGGAGRELWHDNGALSWIAGSGTGDAIVTNCSNECSGWGPWIKVNPQQSMDCVNGGTTGPGDEGAVPFTTGDDCKDCSPSNSAEECTEKGHSAFGIEDLEWSSSCTWNHHCRSNRLPCGTSKECVHYDLIPDGEGGLKEGPCDRWECQGTTTQAWNKKYASTCTVKSQCFRELKGVLNAEFGTCEEFTDYQLVFNRGTGCEKNLGSNSIGQESSQQDVNPALCPTLEYTTHFMVDNGNGDFQYFQNEGGKCVVEWSRLDAPDGINGLSPEYGHAGRNGRWVLTGGSGKGWTFNQRDCSFTCERFDEGADCHGELLEAEMEFMPDLRLVIYRDNGFIAGMAPNSGDYATHWENCATPGTVENSGLNSPINASGEIFKAKRSMEYAFNEYKQAIYQKINSVAGQQPALERMILGEEIWGQEHSYTIDIENLYNKSDDEGYWACSCLSVDANASEVSAADCRLWFYPRNDKDICTTKRLYVGFRSCYNTPWWQVSGGNVYADQDIIDHIPTGLNDDPYCNPLGPTQCEDVNPPTGHVNDFPDLYLEQNHNIPGNESCTPRIIRGRTPCKTDGPSNSAGIALTQHGQVLTADVNDYYYNNSNLSEEVKSDFLKRVSERSNLHALYAGKYGSNINNPSGLQAKIANSRVLPSNIGNNDDGFTPPREDYRYFVNLAGGHEKLAAIPGNRGDLYVDSLEQLTSRCLKNQSGNHIEYVCYVDRDLTISSENPWVIGQDADGNYLSYTVFVTGDLTLDGNTDNDDAVTAVDVGNFLAFIVQGKITINANVGVRMPEPTTAQLIKKCWEGQSATIRGEYPQNDQLRADQTSAVGSIEGIFVADGDIVLQNYENQPPGRGNLCSVDKRFLGQGSFISWSTVKMLRNFSPRGTQCENDVYGVYNTRVPTESFIYRPDLVRNTPSWMKRSTTTFREITGGQ